LGGVQETMPGQAENIDFSLPKPGFTENADHSLVVKTRRDNVPLQRRLATFAAPPRSSFRPLQGGC
jgi:hypothetical protein